MLLFVLVMLSVNWGVLVGFLRRMIELGTKGSEMIVDVPGKRK